MINKENILLKKKNDALKNELLINKRELKIEASLERVRKVAMKMKKRDDMLDICHVISKQLTVLGVKDIRNVQTAIFDETKHVYLNYEYYGKHDKTFITEVDYTVHPVQSAFARQMLKGKGSFFSTGLEGKKLNEFIKHQKAGPEFVDPFLFKAASLTWYWASLGPIAFGISTYSPLTEAEISLYKRFRNVFDLAYRRFLDIEKAEIRAKEALVEASLERVRAVAMGMMKSEDLLNICKIQFKELKRLGFADLRNVLIGIYHDEESYFNDYDYSDFAGGNIHKIPYNRNSLVDRSLMQMKRSRDAFTEFTVEGKELADWKKFRKENGEYDDTRLKGINSLYYYFYSIDKGNIGLSSFKRITEEQLNILKRFRNVFDLAYKRYIDISNAETQAKEARIETALERMRARTMAMQKSDELAETAYVLFQQFEQLGEDPEQLGIGIFNENDATLELWTTINGKIREKAVMVSLNEPIVMHRFYAAWKEGEKKLVIDISGKELQKYNNYRSSLSNIKLDPGRTKDRRVINIAYFSKGAISLATPEPKPVETMQLLERFAAVFDLTYTRFLDLKQAEAQARESQIQLALERVRARTMAMQHSYELAETSAVLAEQFSVLGQSAEQISIGIVKEEEKIIEMWINMMKNPMNRLYSVTINEPSVMQKIYRGWKEKKKSLIIDLTGNELLQYVRFRETLGGAYINEDLERGRRVVHIAYFSEGIITLSDSEPCSPETMELLERFASVFDQTYTRFLDLQKAEAQARDAKIEAALERTRTQSMIMQHSNELDDTLRVFHEQVLLLGIPSAFSFLWLPDEKKDRHIFWAAWAEKNLFKSKAVDYPLDRNEPATAQCLVDWKGKEPIVSYHVPPTGVADYFAAWNELIAGVEQLQPKYFNDGLYYVEAFMRYGCFGVLVSTDLTEDEKKLLGRFATEFERTYTRFLDLQKAEAQAREAQIEAALERVRSKAMSMQKSEDLSAAVAIVFEELDKLNLGMMRCGIGILNKERRTADVFTTAKSGKDTVVQVWGDESMDAHPLLTGAFEAWLQQVDHSYTLKGEDLVNYYKALTGENFHLPTFQSQARGTGSVEQYYYVATISPGGLFAFRESPFPEEAKLILRRFADVFDFTYTRFNDLKQAEEQAKEAKIEVALERVRSRTLAMQRSDELAETAAVLFKQLITLGIEPNRLYINIIKDETGNAEFWITDEDGSKVSSAFETNLNNNSTFKKMFDGWKEEKRSLVIDMQGKELQEYFKYLTSINVPFKGGLSQKRRLQDIAYFSKGFIGMASPDEQPAETLELLERFAAVFNLTYTRFNDLKVAEAHALQAEQDLVAIKEAKQKAEEALAELQVTQKQLIQSEKMASLGELTAGIAHEIQNPLNFVNNFSEVSVELIKEMVDEVDKGNTGEVKAIADDLVQNLEKINHHGKRADAIVKGMLQHSRASSATKEPTDINKLADEYLRLAYHGLRAKDKSFNASMKTDYDESIGNINIIPQDIGRVILNLITNAFYVVNEKKKIIANSSQPIAFEPTIIISTKLMSPMQGGSRGVEISVKDNGNGIPDAIKEKIFQPFFTTKPTGQGTGLGLSLSYDIIKAHGGELKVESEEGAGATFIIKLPVHTA